MAKKEKKQTKVKDEVAVSKAEKYYYYIVSIVAVIALVVALIILIPKAKNDNDNNQEYVYLPKENVFEEISFDIFKEKVSSDEVFLVVLNNKNIDEANYFMYYVNDLATQKNIEKIYYLNTIDIKGLNKSYINIDLGLMGALEESTIIYYDNSIPLVQSHPDEADDFANCYERVFSFFKLYEEEINDNSEN